MLGDPRTQRFIPAPSLDLIAATDIASDGGLRDDQDPRPIITATAWIARQANQQIPVQPSFKKYSAMLVGQISGLSLRVSPDERGVAHVINARWDAVDAKPKRKTNAWRSRTAKSCGPDTATLVSSS